MTKTISLRIDEDLYNSLRTHADAENRSISNFIETATKRYIEEVEFADEFEMESILSNQDLINRMRRGTRDAKKESGRFA